MATIGDIINPPPAPAEPLSAEALAEDAAYAEFEEWLLTDEGVQGASSDIPATIGDIIAAKRKQVST